MILKQANSRTFQTLKGDNFGRSADIQSIVSLPAGNAGIKKTLDFMESWAKSYSLDPEVRGLALKLTRKLPQKDSKAEILALFNYVKYRIRYVHDTRGAEYLQTPRKTLERGQGDCDDKSTLLAALLQSIGYETNFHALGVNGGSICHVVPQVFVSGRWITLDTTENKPAGWYPPNVTISIDSNPRMNGFFSDVVRAITAPIRDTKKIVSGNKTKAAELLKRSIATPIKTTKLVSKGKFREAASNEAAAAKKNLVQNWQIFHDVSSRANAQRKLLHKIVTPKPVQKVESKVVDAVAGALNSPEFHILTTILSFIPLTAPFALALEIAEAAEFVAMAEGLRKKVSALKSNQLRWLQSKMGKMKYVYDPQKKAIRKHRNSKADSILPQYSYDPVTGGFALVSVPTNSAAAIDSVPPVTPADVSAGQAQAAQVVADDVASGNYPSDMPDSGYADSSQYQQDYSEIADNGSSDQDQQSQLEQSSTVQAAPSNMIDTTSKVVNTIVGLATLASFFK